MTFSLRLLADPSWAELSAADGAERVAAFAARASALFPRWRADAAALELFLVAAGGDAEPSRDACAQAVSETGTKSSAQRRVTSGGGAGRRTLVSAAVTQ